MRVHNDFTGEFWVYVLELTTPDSYYVGQTYKLENRLRSHYRGRNPMTAGYKSVVCVMPACNRFDALLLEGETCRAIEDSGFFVNHQSSGDVKEIELYRWFMDGGSLPYR